MWNHDPAKVASDHFVFSFENGNINTPNFIDIKKAILKYYHIHKDNKDEVKVLKKIMEKCDQIVNEMAKFLKDISKNIQDLKKSFLESTHCALYVLLQVFHHYPRQI